MSITERADERTESSGPVGAQLRRARTEQDLSIEDVCQRTNIRPAVVHALENGDLEPSGGAVYARGHVRTLAQALNMDPDPLLANFDASYGAAMPRMPVLVPEPEPAVEKAPRAPRTARGGLTCPQAPLVVAARSGAHCRDRDRAGCATGPRRDQLEEDTEGRAAQRGSGEAGSKDHASEAVAGVPGPGERRHPADRAREGELGSRSATGTASR